MIKKMYSRYQTMSPVAKTTLVLVIANFIQKGLAFISNPIFTRIMPTGEYGIISTFTSWQSVLFIIATLNMTSGVFNNGMLEFKDDRDGFVFSITILSNISTIFCVGIYFLFYRWINPFMDLSYSLLVVMLLYFLFYPAFGYWMGRSRFEYKYKLILIVSVIASFLSTVFSLTFVLLSSDNNKAIAKVVGAESVSIIIGLVFYIYILIRGHGSIKLSYWKYALKINLPLIPHYLSMYVLASSDRIMITKIFDTSKTAIYDVAYTVASVILIFWNSIDSAYAPWIYQKMNEKNYKALNKRAMEVIILFAGISILATLFAPECIKILGPPEYFEGAYIIPSVVCGVYFTAVFSLYMRIELYLKKTTAIMWATIITAIINLILNYLFIPIFGYTAAGYTTLVCYILLALFHMVNLKRFGYGNVYDNKKILLLSGIVVTLILPLSLLYNYFLVRYIIILVILSITIINRKKVLSLIRNK